ncbi:MAG TPA: exonuclease SbcCD subunit D C-terminal domain-containing protein, partial [Acidimicrobiia bacterium]|nr:exonuclease SbcCD subunit D C-terminal domain-containing protein [Acidimicrobiia bacterium]
ESAVAPPDAQSLVWSTLLALRDTGADVIVIAGNHDNAAQFEALRPLAAAAGITVLGRVRRPDDGGVVEVTTDAGERVRVAALPFLSQRYVVRAAQLMADNAAQHAGNYADRCRLLLDGLCAGFGADTVNVVVAHAMVRGGRLGGGERDAQTIEDYYLDPTAFPASAHYVALGHLHRTQQLPGAAPIWYSGSPIQVDFGEGGDDKHAMVVEATAGRPAEVRPVRLDHVRRLRTLEGTVAELEAQAASVGDDLLRIVVDEPARAGLADRVRELLPNAVDIRVAAGEAGAEPIPSRVGLSPHELFAAYLGTQGVDDDRVVRLFARLLDEAWESHLPPPRQSAGGDA